MLLNYRSIDLLQPIISSLFVCLILFNLIFSSSFSLYFFFFLFSSFLFFCFLFFMYIQKRSASIEQIFIPFDDKIVADDESGWLALKVSLVSVGLMDFRDFHFRHCHLDNHLGMLRPRLHYWDTILSGDVALAVNDAL